MPALCLAAVTVVTGCLRLRLGRVGREVAQSQASWVCLVSLGLREQSPTGTTRSQGAWLLPRPGLVTGLRTIVFPHHAGTCDSAAFTAFGGHRLQRELVRSRAERFPEGQERVCSCWALSLNSAWRSQGHPGSVATLAPSHPAPQCHPAY